MRRRRLALACAVTSLALTVAACAESDETGDAQPDATATDTATADDPAAADEPGDVAEPARDLPDLVLGAAEADPCSLLTAEQLAGFGITVTGELDTSDVEPYCAWQDRESTLVRSVFVGPEPLGIELLTERQGNFPYFEGGVEVAGRPAIYIDTLVVPVEQCGVYVDVTAETSLFVNIYLSKQDPLGQDPCTRANEVATVIVGNAAEVAP